jgi:hypothetical protein
MSGNVNHIDIRDPRQLSGMSEAARVAAILAGRVLQAFSQLRPISLARLMPRTQAVALPSPQIASTEVERAKQTLAKYGKPGAPPFLDVVNAWKVLDVADLG